ncbi:MAG: DUF4340 domain-containing protein [Chryseolinea sp.]
MQEKRNKRLLILLIALICITGVALWVKRADQKEIIPKDLFRHFDLQTVNEIRLESRSGKVTLEYNGTRWKVNGEHYADPAMIEVLFATIQQTVPKRPVATAVQDSVRKALENNGVKVSVLSAGSTVESFYAGGNDSKSQAYFVEAETGTPFLVNIPGYRVYVSGIFELTESGWRDKRIFTLNWRNFEALQAQFPNKPADDFKIELVDKFISIPGMTEVDTTQINNFMDNLLSLTAEEFVPRVPVLDSLSKQVPIISIAVKDVAGKLYKLSVYPPIKKTGKIYGLVNEKEWALFARERLSGVVRPRKSFGK